MLDGSQQALPDELRTSLDHAAREGDARSLAMALEAARPIGYA